MRQTLLGQAGPQIGVIAYGCWRFAGTDVRTADAKIQAAIDCGMNLIDTADIYGFGEPAGFGGAEALLGEVIAASPSLRDKIVLATKGGITPPRPYDSSYDYLMAAMDASLARLQTDHVDLYQIHRPDLMAPWSECARALNHMLASGKTRFIGVSNFTVSQTRALQAHLDAPLVSSQPEFSALHQEPMTDGTLDWCSETNATALAWSPLGRGAIPTGKANGFENGEAVMACIDKLAEKHKTNRSAIALAFTLTHQANIVPIIGTQTIERIHEAAAASDVKLEARDFYDLIEAYRGVPMP